MTRTVVARTALLALVALLALAGCTLVGTAAEPVDVEVAGGKVEFSVDPGYRYGIDATFASGTATYVFTSPAA